MANSRPIGPEVPAAHPDPECNTGYAEPKPKDKGEAQIPAPKPEPSPGGGRVEHDPDAEP